MAVHRSPKSTHSNPNPTCTTISCPSSNGTCKHSLVDLLFLLLLLLSSSFLITSVLSYLSRSLSLLSSSSSLSLSLPLSPFFVLSFLAFFALAAASSLLLSRRRCHRPSCKALKRSLEFDLQLQSEDQLRSGKGPVEAVERLPWKGGAENNPDYECLRAELRKMAPVNGRAVLLFREKCGCPVAKLVGWGPRKGPGSKKSKKLLSNGGCVMFSAAGLRPVLLTIERAITVDRLHHSPGVYYYSMFSDPSTNHCPHFPPDCSGCFLLWKDCHSDLNCASSYMDVITSYDSCPRNPSFGRARSLMNVGRTQRT